MNPIETFGNVRAAWQEISEQRFLAAAHFGFAIRFGAEDEAERPALGWLLGPRSRQALDAGTESLCLEELCRAVGGDESVADACPCDNAGGGSSFVALEPAQPDG